MEQHREGDRRSWRARVRQAAIALALILPSAALAFNCSSQASGNWNAAGTWTNCNGTFPQTGDTVTINAHTVTLNANTNRLASLTINPSGSLVSTGSNASDVNLGGNLTNNGTIDFQASSGTNTIFLAGANVTSTWSGGGTWLLEELDLNGGAIACTGACKVELSGSPNLQFSDSDPFLGNSASFTFNALGNATATVTFNRSGNQTVVTTGMTYPNVVLSGSNTKTPNSGTLTILGGVTVDGGVTFDLNNNDPTTNISGSVGNAGTFTGSASAALNITGAFSNTGTFTGNNGAKTLGGSFSNSGTFTSGAGTWTLNGGSAQSITGTVTFQRLTLSNANGLTLNGDVTVSTLMTFTSGNVATGANNLILSANCPGSYSRASGHVIGNLRLQVPNTNPVTCTFHVGDANNYAPVTITKTGTNAGTLFGSTTGSEHPDTATNDSGIDVVKGVNRYWTLTAGTLSSATPYSATFQFCNGVGAGCGVNDVDSGANTANFIVAKKTSGTWSLPTVGTRTGTTTQATGMTGFGEFAVGEAAPAKTNCTSAQSGNWNDPNTWVHTAGACHGAGAIPLIGDTITISSGHTVTLNVNSPRVAGMTVNSTGTLANTGGYTLNLGASTINPLPGNGVLTNNGTLSLGTGSVTLSTDYQFTGGASSTWTLNQLDLSSRNLTFGSSDAYTISFAAASPFVNLGSINTSGTVSTLTFQFGGASQALPVANVIYPSVSLSGSGAKTLTGSGTFDVRGSFTLESGPTFNGGAYNVDLYGNFTNNGGANFNSGATDTGTWTFRGSAVQSVNSTGINTTFPNLTLNNSNGLALNASSMVQTLLTLSNGYVSTGSNILTTLADCPGSVTRTNGFVAGKLRLTFPTGTTTCTFHVGSGTNYAPIGMTIVASAGGTLTGSTTGNEHPNIATSSIDPNLDANRYWTLWTTGDTVTVTSYGATFNFQSGDLDINATATSFVVGKYVGGTWSLPTPVTAGATSTSISNQSGPISATTDFAVGQIPEPCDIPSDLATWAAAQVPPVTLSCVCDNFGRTNLNPSTIYGQNWAVGSISGSFGNPRIVNTGYLRLTDNSAAVSTVANVPSTFPAAGNVIFAEFKHYAYNGTGADGIALTLSDANQTPTPGAFGGSLGFAQKCQNGQPYAPYGGTCSSDCNVSGGCPGFVGGWVGVAIDEWGNYSNNTEGRYGGTAPGQVPDSVSVRGSGSGMSGYPFLRGSGGLSPGIDNAGSASPAYGHFYRIMVDARQYATSHTYVRVERDTTGTGNSYTSVIGSFDIFADNPSQSTVPQNWKLSFTGSTGGANNIHEITGLRICAQTILPPAGYLIQVDNYSPSTCATIPAGKPVVTVKAIDANGNVVTTYNKTVNLSGSTTSGGPASPTTAWSLVPGGANGTLVGSQYTFVLADAGVAQFYLTDSNAEDIYITVDEDQDTIATTLATPLQYRGTAFSVDNNIDTLGAQPGGGVVAGRPHLMKITRQNGCGTDTTYSGAKSLDGWYAPASGDHPSGALAPLICGTNVEATCLPMTGGTCQTLSIAPPALDAGSNNLTLSFTNGVAKFCLAPADVGKYSVNLRDDSNILVPITGSSSTLTARPFAVVVSDVKQGAVNNPATSDATGISMVAGQNFEATVGGYLWNGAADTGANGLPGSVSLATVTAAGLAPHYADSVVLATNTSASTNFAPEAPPGTQGNLSNGTVSVTTGGTATVTTLNYSEVGSFTLTATPADDDPGYLNTADVDLRPRVAIYAKPGSGELPNTWVGRFRPAYFELSDATLINRSDMGGGAGCSPASIFTYMGEPMRVGFTLTAKNAASSPATTRNYAGTYAKLTGTNWTSLGTNDSMGLWMIGTGYEPQAGNTCKVLFSTAAPNYYTSYACTGASPSSLARTAGPRVTTSAPAVAGWTGGAATFSTNAVLERADAPDGPYGTINIGVAPQDGDGVTLETAALDLDANNDATNERKSLGTTTGQRFGLLRLENASGSELLNMRLRLRANYYSGTGWVTNLDDSCTQISNPRQQVALGNYTGSLIGTMDSTHLPTAAVTLSQGQGTILLTAPSCGVGASCPGSMDFALTLGASGTNNNCVVPVLPDATAGAAQPWFWGNWCGGAWGKDPNARATFGTPRSRHIYLRERY